MACIGSYHYERKRRADGEISTSFVWHLCDRRSIDANSGLPAGNCRSKRSEFVFRAASVKQAIDARRSARHARSNVEEVRKLIAWPDDPDARSGTQDFWPEFSTLKEATAEACCGSPTRMREIIGWIERSLRESEFQIRHRAHRIARSRSRSTSCALTGGLVEHLRFFHSVDPAISRKRDIAGQAVKSEARLGVRQHRASSAKRCGSTTSRQEPKTSSPTASISHNCYARPSHAYVGLSPGLDFETKLFYKADAAKLLEAELAAPNYRCAPIMLGANTDPYQPLEKSLQGHALAARSAAALQAPRGDHHQGRAGGARRRPARGSWRATASRA